MVSTTVAPEPQPPGLAVGEKLPGLDLWAAVPGNDVDVDRINLVFAPWGWTDLEAFTDLVAGALSWDGDAYLYRTDGRITAEDREAAGASLGLFAIEPWRSSRDRFNVWYTFEEPEEPVSWLNSDEEPFPVPDATVVVLALDAWVFNPDLISVAGQDGTMVGPESPVRRPGARSFANAVVVIDSAFPAGGMTDVAHELGHAMFNLPDEYVGEVLGFDGRFDLSSWPSCADGPSEAETWWGDIVGDVDPMMQIWADEMAEAGFELVSVEALAEQVRIDFVDGGCYGVTGSTRATIDSLMNSGIPVVGSVNRRWAEQVLSLWDGEPRGA